MDIFVIFLWVQLYEFVIFVEFNFFKFQTATIYASPDQFVTFG